MFETFPLVISNILKENWTLMLRHNILVLSPLFPSKEIDSTRSMSGFFLTRCIERVADRKGALSLADGAPHRPTCEIQQFVECMERRTGAIYASLRTAVPPLAAPATAPRVRSMRPRSAMRRKEHPLLGFDVALCAEMPNPAALRMVLEQRIRNLLLYQLC